MHWTNKLYDRSKWLALVFLPSLAVFVGGLGEVYQWKHVSTFVVTLNLCGVFLGSLVQVSSQHYHKKKEFVEGEDV